jgi:hypothetical protein
MVVAAINTRVLVLNPAFLQEIKDCNPDLWHTQHELRQVCSCQAEPSEITRLLVRMLDDFRDQLALQFALEESYGFLEVPEDSSVANQIDETLVHRVHAQHCPLYLELSELAERAEELQYRGIVMSQLMDLIAAVRRFDEKLTEHENLEGELIERSLHVV